MNGTKLQQNCSKKIIKAYTISKSANLKQIAQDGHVYNFKRDVLSLYKHQTFLIEKIGINNATILNNFCSHHDKELFAVIEDKNIIFSQEQIFMFAYRSICNELYLKKGTVKNNQNIYKKIPLMSVNMINNTNFMIVRSALAIKDLKYLKKEYDKNIVEKDFENKINYYIIIIDTILEIYNNAGWIPTIDYQNNKLANLNDTNKYFNTLTVNTIQFKNKGAIIFAWNNILDSEESINFIKSLDKIDNTYKPFAILKWLFECNENIYFSIKWWEALDKKLQNYLIDSYMNILRSQNISDYEELNGMINWKVIDIKTNIKSQL
jgi:hypothetical protein